MSTSITGILREIGSDQPGVQVETLEPVTLLAMEIAREGRRGQSIGTMFVVSDEANVLEHSKCLILDPLIHHPDEEKHITNPNMWETLKELAQLDGAFIVSEHGIVISAARYIDATARNIDLPLGLGSRHMAAASITLVTDAVAVVVSESSIVRIFDEGKIVAEIIPELYLLKQYGLHTENLYTHRSDE